MDYATAGISWTAEKVSRTEGNTKIQIRGDAQIPTLVDLDKAREHFGDTVLLGSINGTSWRVMAQDVSRRALANGPVDADALKQMVYDRLRGVRNATVATRVVKSYALPNGTSYNGTDLIEYQQAFIAAMVDLGLSSDIAITQAANLKL